MADTLHPMYVEVISPDGPVYRQDGVDMVVARADDGEFAVMKGHLPLAAALEISPVRIKKGKEEQTLAVFGGFLEMNDNRVSIVSPLVELPESIDVERAQAAKARAEARLSARTKDTDVERACLALSRAIMRLHVAAGGK